jgi:hypothetical protein
VKGKGKITNKEYQEIIEVSKPTATRDLSELVEIYKLLENTGFGAGNHYGLDWLKQFFKPANHAKSPQNGQDSNIPVNILFAGFFVGSIHFCVLYSSQL